VLIFIVFLKNSNNYNLKFNNLTMHPRTPLSLKNNFKKEENQDCLPQGKSSKPKIKVLGKIQSSYFQ